MLNFFISDKMVVFLFFYRTDNLNAYASKDLVYIGINKEVAKMVVS